jgi:mRNA-degrading endonuclease RelE of RelBE toxin-antitoxin system
VSREPAEEPYELRATSTVRRALSESLPKAVAAAAYAFITGLLLRDRHRVGKRLLPPMDDRFSARRGTYRVIGDAVNPASAERVLSRQGLASRHPATDAPGWL